MCDNEMSRDHDAPLEYLRILASLKLRFGLATLVTAHGALPVCSPIEEQGHSATQWFRGSSSFPMNVTGRQAEVHSGSASITRQSARRFVSLIAGLPTSWQSLDSRLRRYRSCSRPFLFDQVAIYPQHYRWRSIHRQRQPPKHTSPFHRLSLVSESPFDERWPNS